MLNLLENKHCLEALKGVCPLEKHKITNPSMLARQTSYSRIQRDFQGKKMEFSD